MTSGSPRRRLTSLITLAGLIVVVSCGGSVSDDERDTRLTAGTGGRTNGAGSASGGKASKPEKPNNPDDSYGGTTPDDAPSWGGCFGVLTSGGFGSVCSGTDGGAPPCEGLKDAASCEANGCVATTGTLSAMLEGGGGAPTIGGGSSGGAPSRCSRTEDVFISCEEGYGGAIQNYACDESCSRCIEGPWTVGRYEPYTRRDCYFSCENGVPSAGDEDLE